MNRRDFSSALLATGATASLLLGTGAARAQGPVEGRDYSLIQPPQPPAPQGPGLPDPGKTKPPKGRR